MMGGSLNPEMGGKLQGVCMCHPEGLGLGGGGGTGLGLVGTWSRWRADDGGKRTNPTLFHDPFLHAQSVLLPIQERFVEGLLCCRHCANFWDTETHKPRSCPLRVL